MLYARPVGLPGGFCGENMRARGSTGFSRVFLTLALGVERRRCSYDQVVPFTLLL